MNNIVKAYFPSSKTSSKKCLNISSTSTHTRQHPNSFSPWSKTKSWEQMSFPAWATPLWTGNGEWSSRVIRHWFTEWALFQTQSSSSSCLVSPSTHGSKPPSMLALSRESCSKASKMKMMTYMTKKIRCRCCRSLQMRMKMMLMTTMWVKEETIPSSTIAPLMLPKIHIIWPPSSSRCHLSISTPSSVNSFPNTGLS